MVNQITDKRSDDSNSNGKTLTFMVVFGFLGARKRVGVGVGQSVIQWSGVNWDT